jgi:hypothetical protein
MNFTVINARHIQDLDFAHARDIAEQRDLMIVPLIDVRAVLERKVSFRQAIRMLEHVLLEAALNEADGKPSEAAQILGFRYHQSVISMLTRHRDLNRSVVLKRHKPIFDWRIMLISYDENRKDELRTTIDQLMKQLKRKQWCELSGLLPDELPGTIFQHLSSVKAKDLAAALRRVGAVVKIEIGDKLKRRYKKRVK